MTARICAALVACLLSVVAAQNARQPAPSAAAAGTAQIGGVVTTADGTSQPIRRAIVRITATELRGSREIATDDRGRFLFTGLPGGRYQVSVSKAGYVTASYGQKRPRGLGTPISLAEGERALNILIPLAKGAVITGLVTDVFGQPVPGAVIEVVEVVTVNGQATRTQTGQSEQTDERGQYRIYGLFPGKFLVGVSNLWQGLATVRPTSADDLRWATQMLGASASATYSPPPAGQTVAFTPVFHPSATDVSDAVPIELEAGAERAGVDIVIRFVPVARVAGAATLPDGRPAVPGAAYLLPESNVDTGLVASSSNTRVTLTVRGEFSFTSVPSGRYTLVVQASADAGAGGRGRAGGAPMLWATAPVAVDGRDIADLALVLQPGLTVQGRIVLDAAATTPLPDFQTIRVGVAPPPAMRPFGPPPPPAQPRADGTFVLTGIMPGQYRLSASVSTSGPGATATWIAKSIVVQSQERLDRYFDIGGNIDDVVVAMTDKISSLTGKLMDGQGKPAPDYFVIAIPVDRSLWMQGLARAPRSVRPANDGTYRFPGLLPGEYYLAAATDMTNSDLFDASYLEQLIPAAIKLTIAEGEKKVQDLRIK